MLKKESVEKKRKKASDDYNKSLYDVPEKFHFNKGDKIKDRKNR